MLVIDQTPRDSPALAPGASVRPVTDNKISRGPDFIYRVTSKLQPFHKLESITAALVTDQYSSGFYSDNVIFPVLKKWPGSTPICLAK